MAEARPGWGLKARGLTITEAHARLIVLRVKHSDPACHNALGAAFGLHWPTDPNTVSTDTVTVLWLSPQEWLIKDGDFDAVRQRVASACTGTLHHIADISDGYVVFAVGDEHKHSLLAKGCSLDLHPRVFAGNQCAQTRLAQVPVLIIANPIPHRPLEIVVDVSFTAYLRTWFEDAAREYSPQGAGS